MDRIYDILTYLIKYLSKSEADDAKCECTKNTNPSCICLNIQMDFDR